ncbi:hypothetical protein U1Q18_052410 [Sarracenia purpurea var. burkii]
MADTSEVNIPNFSDIESDNEETPSVEELQEALTDSLRAFNEVKKKNKSLLKEMDLLKSKLEVYENEKKVDAPKVENDFEKENVLLKQKIIDLNLIITKFTKGEKYLEMILGTKCTFNKEGLGFNPNEKKTVLKESFDQDTTNSKSCDFCGKSGHTLLSCIHRLRGEKPTKKVWVKKGESPPKIPKRPPHAPLPKPVHSRPVKANAHVQPKRGRQHARPQQRPFRPHASAFEPYTPYFPHMYGYAHPHMHFYPNHYGPNMNWGPTHPPPNFYAGGY